MGDAFGRHREQKREAEMLVKSLVKAEGNITEAARLLGMPRQTLQYRLKKLGIVPKNWPSSAK